MGSGAVQMLIIITLYSVGLTEAITGDGRDTQEYLSRYSSVQIMQQQTKHIRLL